MKLLFITDLHGDIRKYDRLYRTALRKKVDVVINCGDMLPKSGHLFQQDRFITGYLNDHFQRFEQSRIPYLCFLGNDDLRIVDGLFEETCQRYPLVQNIAQRKAVVHGMEFIGMNWVVDYPFRLKDRCRKDNADYQFQRQLGTGLVSIAGGWKEIENWREYAQTLPTIADELQRLPFPAKMRHAIYVMHMPPAYLGLDVCGHGEQVGSKAIYRFLQEHQPLYSLHGHIHESPAMSGVWQASIGRTICIQPGQMSRYTYVVIDCDLNTVERFIE